jgi:hypothetical protein
MGSKEKSLDVEQFMLEGGRTIPITHLELPLNPQSLIDVQTTIEQLMSEIGITIEPFFFYRALSRRTSGDQSEGRTHLNFRDNLQREGVDKPLKCPSDFFTDVGKFSPAFFRLGEIQNSPDDFQSAILIYNPDRVSNNDGATDLEEANLFCRKVNLSISTGDYPEILKKALEEVVEISWRRVQ